MNKAIGLLLAFITLAWAGASYASDRVNYLKDDRMEIRSILDSDAPISRTEPVSISLPAKPSLADKQLFALLKDNLLGAGFTVTTPDKSTWSIVATVKDASSFLSYDQKGFTPSADMSGTFNYAIIKVVVCKSADPATPIWESTVYSYDDLWMDNQEDVVLAILSTYGINFYYHDVDPSDVPKYVIEHKDQPTVLSIEDIRAQWTQYQMCAANPKAKVC